MKELPGLNEVGSEEVDYIHTGAVVEAINNGLNNGRGISSIRDVARALQQGDTKGARATIVGEWDKISSHPEVADYLIAQGLFTPIDFSNYPGE